MTGMDYSDLVAKIKELESDAESWKDRAFIWADNCKKMQKALIEDRARGLW